MNAGGGDARPAHASGEQGPDRERVVLHVDIDAFFASVEQLRYPQLRGRPVIVGNGVIASCSYAARRSGCYAGQSLTQARRVCPEAVILDGCAAWSNLAADIVARHVPDAWVLDLRPDG